MAIFDDGNKDFSELCRQCERLMNCTPGRANDEVVTALQSADLAAWEFRRGYETVLQRQSDLQSGDRIQFRGSFDELMASYRSHWMIFNYGELVHFCDFNEVPKRD